MANASRFAPLNIFSQLKASKMYGNFTIDPLMEEASQELALENSFFNLTLLSHF